MWGRSANASPAQRGPRREKAEPSLLIQAQLAKHTGHCASTKQRRAGWMMLVRHSGQRRWVGRIKTLGRHPGKRRYRFTWGRGRRTLAQDSGRTKTIEKKCRMAVLITTTRGMSCRRENFSRFSHLKIFHSQQLSLEKVHTRTQTVTMCGDTLSYPP